jgi:hypothetical protein
LFSESDNFCVLPNLFLESARWFTICNHHLIFDEGSWKECSMKRELLKFQWMRLTPLRFHWRMLLSSKAVCDIKCREFMDSIWFPWLSAYSNSWFCFVPELCVILVIFGLRWLKVQWDGMKWTDWDWPT